MKRKDSFLMQNVAGEYLLVPLGSQVLDMNGILTLNPVAACLWELLAQDSSVDELAAAVSERFDVESDRALADVQTFLDEMVRRGLLTE